MEIKTTYQIIKIADVLNGNAVLNLRGQAQIDFLREVNNKDWVSLESIKSLLDDKIDYYEDCNIISERNYDFNQGIIKTLKDLLKELRGQNEV